MGSITPSEKPPVDIDQYPKLDDKQLGHLRHFHNLVSQADGEWAHFGSVVAQQEWDDAYRYQLATMAYAIGVTHYHRLPAMRTTFKTLMRRVIHKMMLREVWAYWFNTSLGGTLLDPDLTELRKPWADPVLRENIMYSGHLLLMTSLYGMLFDDDEFEKKGSLTFTWDPVFWGLGREDFVYDNRSLQAVILGQMEANGWVGVCCEPNAVFVVCNQFPIIATRYNDSRDGTNKVDAVLEKYKEALAAKGMIQKDGMYASFFAVKQKRAIPARQGAHTAWANAYMNTWNSEVVHSLYDKQMLGFLTRINGKTELQSTRVAMAFRYLVQECDADPYCPQTLEQARETSSKFTNPKLPFETISWATFPQMLAELGKEEELKDLLEYADKNLNPTWENGGLYYPRNDGLFDGKQNTIHMDPHSGNSGIAYSRLNVKDGQKQMWDRPWTRELLATRPWVDGISLGDDIDVLRGTWDDKKRALVISLRRWRGPSRNLTFFARNIPAGEWAVYVNGALKDVQILAKTSDIELKEEVGEEELDIILVAAEPDAQAGKLRHAVVPIQREVRL